MVCVLNLHLFFEKVIEQYGEGKELPRFNDNKFRGRNLTPGRGWLESDRVTRDKTYVHRGLASPLRELARNLGTPIRIPNRDPNHQFTISSGQIMSRKEGKSHYFREIQAGEIF